MLRQYCVNRVHIVRKILFGIATRRGIYEVTLGAIDVVAQKFAKHCATQLSRLPLLHILWYFSIRLVLVATCFRESINTFNNLHKGFLPTRMLRFRHGNSVYSQAQASFLLLRPTPLLHFLPDTKHYNYFISFTWWPDYQLKCLLVFWLSLSRRPHKTNPLIIIILSSNGTQKMRHSLPKRRD